MSRDSTHRFAMSLIPQTNYDTPLAPSGAPKNYEEVAKEGYDLAQYTSTPITNQGYSTGSPYATKSRPNAHDVTQTFNERMSSQLIGRRLLAAFGDYSVSLVATGVYKHVFRPLNPQSEAQLPVYSYVEKILNGITELDADIIHDLMYPSFMAESFGLESPSSIDNGAFLMGATNWRGSGKQLGSANAAQTGSGVNFHKATAHVVLDDAKTENFFNSTSAVATLFEDPSQAGDGAILGCDFRGLSFNHNNNLKANQGYEGCAKFQNAANPESGSVRGNLPIGNQTTDMSLMFLVSKAIAQSFNPLKRLREQSVFSAELSWRGALIANVASVDYYHTLTLLADKLTAREVSVTSNDELDMFSVACETLAPGAVQPFRFELINNVPTYLSL